MAMSLPVYIDAQGRIAEVGPTTPFPVSAPANRTTVTVTVAGGATLSGPSPALAGRAVTGVLTPASWTTAGISFQVSVDGLTFYPLLDPGGAEVTAAAVPASRAVSVDPSLFLGWGYLRVRSGTDAAPAAQTAASTLTLVLV